MKLRPLLAGLALLAARIAAEKARQPPPKPLDALDAANLRTFLGLSPHRRTQEILGMDAELLKRIFSAYKRWMRQTRSAGLPWDTLILIQERLWPQAHLEHQYAARSQKHAEIVRMVRAAHLGIGRPS